MVLSVGFSSKDIFNRDNLLVALWTGILVTLVEFIMDFFGLGFLLSFVPEGFQLLAVVFVSVLISRKLVVKFRGKEVI